MSESYLGEIRMFGGNFAPQGWALCNGQVLSIAENEALFSLLGTTYGGNGQTTFALPDLQGRVPLHQGQSVNTSTTYALGQKGGSENVTLTMNQLPAHTHTVLATTAVADLSSPTGNLWADTSQTGYSNYSTAPSSPVTMNTTNISVVGNNQAHENMMPSLTISFIIALQGIYPPQP